MSHKADIQAYQQRWEQVEAVLAAERRYASLELRWRQLNAAYGLAKSLGLIRPDPSEYEVYARWAKLKEKLGATIRRRLGFARPVARYQPAFVTMS